MSPVRAQVVLTAPDHQADDRLERRPVLAKVGGHPGRHLGTERAAIEEDAILQDRARHSGVTLDRSSDFVIVHVQDLLPAHTSAVRNH